MKKTNKDLTKKHNFKKSRISGTKVIVNGPDRDSIDVAISLFKRVVKDSGKLNEFRDRQQFIKSSAKRRQVIQSATSRQKRQTLYEKYLDSLTYN